MARELRTDKERNQGPRGPGVTPAAILSRQMGGISPTKCRGGRARLHPSSEAARFNSRSSILSSSASHRNGLGTPTIFDLIGRPALRRWLKRLGARSLLQKGSASPDLYGRRGRLLAGRAVGLLGTSRRPGANCGTLAADFGPRLRHASYAL